MRQHYTEWHFSTSDTRYLQRTVTDTVLDVICILCMVSYDFCLCSFSSPLWKPNICPEESFLCASVAVLTVVYYLAAVETILWESKS